MSKAPVLDHSKPWTLTIGEHGSTVYAFERKDKGLDVWVRWTDEALPGKDKRRKAPLGVRVRDSKGMLTHALIRAATLAAGDFAAKVRLGVELKAPKAARPITVSEGFDRMLDPITGKTLSKRYRKTFEGARKRLEIILLPGTPLAAIKSGDIRGIWRTMARQSAAAGHNGGHRSAQVTVAAFYAMTSWLQGAELIPRDMLLPLKGWKKECATDWKAYAGSVPPVQALRYSAAELSRIFDVAAYELTDPRICLAVSVGGEARLGQVIRAMRSQLILPRRDKLPSYKVPEHGTFESLGEHTKNGVVVHLTADERRRVDVILDTGYLSKLETARLNKVIDDYPLFPAGHVLKGGIFPISALQPMSRESALTWYLDLEKLAAVAHVRGRGWYGVRRLATDRVADETSDPRVSDGMFGNSPDTRNKRYLEKRRLEILAKTGDVRAAYRANLTKPDAVPDTADDA